MLAASELPVQLPRYTEVHAMYFRHGMNETLQARGNNACRRVMDRLETCKSKPCGGNITETVEIAPGLSNSAKQFSNLYKKMAASRAACCDPDLLMRLRRRKCQHERPCLGEHSRDCTSAA